MDDEKPQPAPATCPAAVSWAAGIIILSAALGVGWRVFRICAGF